MPRNYYNKDGVFYHDIGSRTYVIKEGKNDKYFGVVAMCGHCGTGYFIPILFQVIAKDLDSAIIFTKNLPRVKRDARNCILAATEISETEYWFIKKINDHDKYLTSNSSYDKESRRIVLPIALDVVRGRVDRRRDSRLNRDTILNLKFSNNYHPRWVLQRYFAPVKRGNSVVYPKKVSVKQMLEDYYRVNAYYYGIKKHKNFALEYYIKLFGLNNSLGIGFKQDILDTDNFYYTQNGNVLGYEFNGEQFYQKTTKEFYEQIVEAPHIYASKQLTDKEIYEQITILVKNKFNEPEEVTEAILKLDKLCGLYLSTGTISKKHTNKLLDTLKVVLDENNVDKEIDKLENSQSQQETSPAVEKFNRRMEKFIQMSNNQGQVKE